MLSSSSKKLIPVFPNVIKYVRKKTLLLSAEEVGFVWVEPDKHLFRLLFLVKYFYVNVNLGFNDGGTARMNAQAL